MAFFFLAATNISVGAMSGSKSTQGNGMITTQNNSSSCRNWKKPMCRLVLEWGRGRVWDLGGGILCGGGGGGVHIIPTQMPLSQSNPWQFKQCRIQMMGLRILNMMMKMMKRMTDLKHLWGTQQPL